MTSNKKDEYLAQNTIDVNVTNNCSFLRTIHGAIMCPVPHTIPL